MKDLFGDNGALFSEDKKNRYALWRIWDTEKPMVMFIGLNPSTANESQDDPTIRRVVNFANSWGYGGVYMLNLFSYVTPYPEQLQTDDQFETNIFHIDHYSKLSNEIVFAWGNFKEAKERAGVLIGKFPNAKALQINKNGTPKHPLYVRSDIERIKFKN